MINLTAIRLKNFVLDFDYEVTIEQAQKILEVLDDCLGTFTTTDIEMATNYVLNGNKSIFAKYFQ